MDTLKNPIKATTIIAVKKGNKLAMAGDGQVTFGDTILKAGTRKIRKIYNDSIVVGFAGASADAFTLLEKFEQKIEEYQGDMGRSAVELAKEWRSDKILRRLDALLLVGNVDSIFVISGMGDVIQPDDGIAAIGSGGPYALAAARALAKHSKLSAYNIVKEAMLITSQICIYTNDQIIIEELPA